MEDAEAPPQGMTGNRVDRLPVDADMRPAALCGAVVPSHRSFPAPSGPRSATRPSSPVPFSGARSRGRYYAPGDAGRETPGAGMMDPWSPLLPPASPTPETPNTAPPSGKTPGRSPRSSAALLGARADHKPSGSGSSGPPSPSCTRNSGGLGGATTATSCTPWAARAPCPPRGGHAPVPGPPHGRRDPVRAAVDADGKALAQAV